MKSVMLLVLVVLLTPQIALAGANAGGTLILHASPELEYSADVTNYCGQSGLSACSLAVVTVPFEPEVVTVFHAIAAFPDSATPRLAGIAFGIDYDPDKFIFISRGGCADFELADHDWPGSGTGTSLTWTTAHTETLVEVYWFAGYIYTTEDSARFAVTPHPTKGGAFADDGVPSNLDPIEDFGSLGFGAAGHRTCPVVPGQDTGGDSTSGDTSPGDEGTDGGTPEVPPVEGEPFSESITLCADQVLSCRRGADSVLVRGGETATFAWTAGCLYLNGLKIRPFPPPQPRVLTLEQLQLLYKDVPAIRQAISEQTTGSEHERWLRATALWHGQQDSLMAVVRAVFADLVQHYSCRAATDSCAALFRSSPLVSFAYVDPHQVDQQRRTSAVSVRYKGTDFTVGVVLSPIITPSRPFSPQPIPRSEAASLVNSVSLIARNCVTARIDLTKGMHIATGSFVDE